MSGNIIRSAIHEWYTDPVITSLDSIATPVEFVQFPTITVCNNKWIEVQDNWAFLESLLNFVDFHCYSPKSAMKHSVDCKLTDPLRKDFKFLFKSIVDLFDKWLFQNGNLTTSLKFLRDKERGPHISKLLQKAVETIQEGRMSLDDLKALSIEYFNQLLPANEVCILQSAFFSKKVYCFFIEKRHLS